MTGRARGVSGARPRVAWWSPLPPHHSGIADYSAELVPHLAAYWDIDLFVDGIEVVPELAERHRVVDVRETDPAPLHDDYDAVLYHIGNGPAHIYAYEALLRRPGLVVLHDVALTHLVADVTHGRGRTDLLYHEFRAQHGDAAAEALRRSVYLHEPAPWLVDPLRFPLNRRVLAAAQALLVHSHFAAAEIRRARPEARVEVVEHHVAPAPPGVAVRSPAPGDPLVLCTAGYLTPAKRVESVLHALARLRGRVPFAYHVVGALAPGYRLTGVVRDLGLDEHVALHGRVDQRTLYAFLTAADVCVNLRQPTSGETSGIVQRALACGRPVIVTDAGWFAELPDDAVVKIPPGPDEVDALVAAIEALAGDPERRAALGRGARRYADERTPESRAALYARFVAAHANPTLATRWAAMLADAGRELGLGAEALGRIAGDVAGGV